MRAHVSICLLVAACSTPKLDATPFACATDSQCGTGHICALDGRCVDKDAPIGAGRVTVLIESGAHTSEAGVSVTLRVKLSSQPRADVVLTAAVGDPSEASIAPTSALLTASNWETGTLFTVTGVDDDELDGPVDYLVTFTPSSEDPRFGNAPIGAISLTNDDDDSPAILARVIEGASSEAGGAARVAIRLGARPSARVTVGVSVDVNDVTPSAMSFTFASNDFATEQILVLTGKDDLVADGDMDYTLLLSADGTPEYAGLTAQVSLRSIDGVCGNGLVDGVEACDGVMNAACVTADNPTPSEQHCGTDCQCGGPTVIVRPSGPSTTEAGGVVQLSISLRTRPESAVTVSLSSVTPNDEVEVSPTSVTLNATNYAQPQIITVRGRDDQVADGDQDVAVVFDITSTDTTYALLTIAPIIIKNVDDDVAAIRLVKVDGTSSEAGDSASFTVALTSEPTGTVDLQWVVAPTSETVQTGARWSVDASNWSTPRTHTLVGKDDHQADGDKDYIVTVRRTGGSASEYTDVTAVTATFRSVDGVCGNDLIDGIEACDGVDRDTCVEHGIAFGESSCAADCKALSLATCGWQFVQIASTHDDTGCAVRASGELVCWGRAASFKLAEGARAQKVALRASSSGNTLSFCALLTTGALACQNTNLPASSGEYVDVAVGGSSSTGYACGVDSTGALHCASGFPTPPSTETYTRVAMNPTGNHACALTTSGTIRCWGGNTTTFNDAVYADLAVPANCVYGLRQDGTVRTSCGTINTTQTYTAIAGGVGLTPSGDVVQLGDGTTKVYPALSGLRGVSTHCAITSEGGAECRVSGAPRGIGHLQAFHEAALRMDGVVIERSGWRPTHTHLPAGRYASLGQSTVDSWFGIQADGRVRHATSSLDAVTTNIRVTKATGLNDALACGIRLDRTLVCWGNQATSMSPPAGQYTELGSNSTTAVATRSDGIVSSWSTFGSTPNIQLPSDGGYGPLAVDNSVACFAKKSSGAVTCPTLLANQLPNPNSGFVQLAAGNSAGVFCGLRADGTIACWGSNAFRLGTVPSGNDFVFVSVARSARAVYAILRSGEVVSFGPDAAPILP